MTAVEDLTALVNSLPGADLLTDKMKTDALAAALIPDSFGTWPGQTGYVNTHDVYFAAVQLVQFLRAQPFVRQTSSEGTSVAVDAPDWESLVSYYLSMSPIAQISSTGILTMVPIPEVPHVKRVPMEDGELL